MHWVTCALGDLGFGQFGKLGLCRPWVTWTLNNLLLNLIVGKLDVLKNLTRAFMAESISGLFKEHVLDLFSFQKQMGTEFFKIHCDKNSDRKCN